MQFQVLGPLSVAACTGEPLDVSRPKLRTLLAVLLADANATVHSEALIDSLWGSNPPRSARENLKTYVWALRRALSPADLAGAPISTSPHGYAVRVQPECLDLLTFARYVSDGAQARRSGDLARAVKHYEGALLLWRGSAFEDVCYTSNVLAVAAQRLNDQRLSVVEELIDIRLESGRHIEVIGELQDCTAQHPLRERLWERLMLALYRSGRQSDALAAYQRLRKHLIEEVGVEPGPAVRTLHQRILAADPALIAPSADSAGAPPAPAPPFRASATPRQLPLDVPTFVGRDAELAEITRLLPADDADKLCRIVILHGAPGVGKSALAVRAANLLSARFPDGQLYLNLRGATPGVLPLRPADGLGRLLRTLGIPAADVPQDLDESSALFRTMLADRRMLIVLDNAATAAQLRPLLPGSARTGVMVTSRASLAAVDGAVHLPLGPLSPQSSRAMLEELIGADRAAADAEATRRLAELCDRLPLGLHVAASRLQTRSTWTVQDMVDRLTDERRRLIELAAGDLAVRSSLSISLTLLQRSDDPDDRAAAHALCLLGLLRVAEIDVDLAAALFDASLAHAERTIERLADAHLVEAVQPGHYHLHDLVRLFANEAAATAVPAPERAAALTRGLSYYLATARQATRLLYPHRAPYHAPDAGVSLKQFAGPADARRWLERERANIRTVVGQALAGQAEHTRLGVGLSLALHWFFCQACYPHDTVELNEKAIPVARGSASGGWRRTCTAAWRTL